MDEKCKYSFVLPAYKARFFKEAIGSILAQTYTGFELIIVNDASPEDLDSVVKSYNDPRIRYYVNEHNIGSKDLVAQWNHCLEYASGDYVILASDDDVYSPMYLEKMDELVRKYPEVNVFRPRVRFVDAEGNVLRSGCDCKEQTFLSEFIYRWMTDSISSGIPFYILKKSALGEIGGFVKYPLAWGSDDLTVMSLSVNNGVVFSNEHLFSFRLSDINISTKKNDYKTFFGKLSAMKLMYIDLQTCLSGIQTRGDEDNYYKQKIVSNLKPYMQGKTFALMMNTELLIVVRNLKQIFECEWIERKWFYKAIIYFFYKKLFK